MIFEEFKEEIIRRLNSRTGKTFDTIQIEKNNGVTLEAVTVRNEKGEIAPVIYLDSFYREYEDGRDMEEIVGQIIRMDSGNTGSGFRRLVENFPHYGAIREQISYRLVNYGKNEGILKGVPHRRFLDLAIVYHVVCFDEETVTGSIRINNGHADAWGVTEEMLYEAAWENTPKLLPAELDSVKGILQRLGLMRGIPGEEIEQAAGHGMPLYTLTNERHYQGAGCVLYPGILQKIADVMDCNLFVLPSSVHETLILPDNGIHTADGLREIVCDVNRTQVAEEEILSYSVYWFERGKGLQLA